MLTTKLFLTTKAQRHEVVLAKAKTQLIITLRCADQIGRLVPEFPDEYGTG